MKLNVLGEKKHVISEDMYGLFFEDINYSLDGGLHAEMLENRNFEALFCYGKKDDYKSVFDGKYAWSVYGDGASCSYISMSKEAPLNEINPHYMIFHAKEENASFTNKAYDGIYLKRNHSYRVSFYAKAAGNFLLSISVNKDGEELCKAQVPVEGEEWTRYECRLEASVEVEKGDFVVTADHVGTICFDQFSMMPDDAVLGIFRTDLVEKLRALNPSFMRFPGGCVVEGNSLSNRYRWKDTIAPVTERPHNWNRWAVHNCEEDEAGPYSHYGQTLGVGYYEYFLLCEELGAKPLPVLSVGLACQFMSTEKLPLDSSELQEYIQDVLDLIEFCNGGSDTVWGSRRIMMGHAAPFNLEYVGIGNEQWQDENSEFFERYLLFEKAVHDRFPKIKLIGTAGPDVWTEKYEKAWEWIRQEEKENPNVVYAMDEHYYVAPEWLLEHTHFYDDYDRKIKVFAGEYACHIKGLAGQMNMPEANNMRGALAEAAFLTGVERNADVVVMAAYAPLLARKGYTQWSPDLIWFDGKESYATPSYYVQQLYSRYRGAYTLACSLDTQEDEGIFANAVVDKDGAVIIKLVNVTETDVRITLEGTAIEGLDLSKAEAVVLEEGNISEKKIISADSNTVLLSKNSFAVLKCVE